MTKLSIIINSYKEASIIEDCLASIVGLSDDIVVCDMASHDGTEEIAKRYGAKFIIHEWRPIVEEARLTAIKETKGEWVLILDPDMRVPKGTCLAIQNVLKRKDISYVDFYLDNVYFGKLCRHGHGSQPYRKLIKRELLLHSSTEIFSYSMHSTQETSGHTLSRSTPIMHQAYNSLIKAHESHSRYAFVEARQMIERGIRGSTKRLIMLPLKKIYGDIVIRRAIKDGTPGILMTLIVANYIFIRELLVIGYSNGLSRDDLQTK